MNDDFYMDFDEVAGECYAIARENGFHDYDIRDLPEWAVPLALLGRMMLIVTEAAEGAEAIRIGGGNLDEELADIVIRVGDFAQSERILIGPAIRAKMQKNRERPHMHGGKLA